MISIRIFGRQPTCSQLSLSAVFTGKKLGKQLNVHSARPLVVPSAYLKQKSGSAAQAAQAASRAPSQKPSYVAKNICFRQCQDLEESIPAGEASSTPQRKLVVMLCWLEAREKHIEKHRQFYLDRGFDVLSVRSRTWELVLPNRGAERIARDTLNFLIARQYSNVVVHGFSVGGYMLGRILLQLDKRDEAMREKIKNSVRGVIFDSLVTIEGVVPGLASSLTENETAIRMLENMFKFYMKFAENVAIKNYRESSDKIWGAGLYYGHLPLPCPGLFLISRADRVISHEIITRLADGWVTFGGDVRKWYVDDAPHVGLYSMYRDQYLEQVDSFLKHIRATPREPQVKDKTGAT